MDKEGFIYIKGRRKEIIVTGGENVSPKEVEDVVCSHEAVREAAVVGLAHERWGEAVTAFIILNNDNQISKDELLKYCRARLAGYKCPKSIVFLDDLPHTTSGKVLKRKLKDWYAKEV